MRRIPHYAIANDLKLCGYSNAEIAAKLGVKTDTVRAYFSRARRRGHSGDYPPPSVIAPLPADIRQWVQSCTPPGAHIEDTIRAIIIDAFNEENLGVQP